MERTKLSSKGQIVIPKTIRDANGWGEGDTFVVEEQAGGVFLRPQADAPFPRKTIDEVIGILKHEGAPKTLDEMSRGIEAEAHRMWAGTMKRKT